MWQALEDTGLILAWHVTVFFPPEGDPSRGKLAGHLHPHEVLHHPVPGRLRRPVRLGHPGDGTRSMKVVIAESGAGWLPWVVEELDYRHWRLWEAEEFWADKGGIPLKTKPSDLFKRQIYSTFQQSPVTMRLLEFYGDNLLWASDYPHPDSIWPNSKATSSGPWATCRPRRSRS